MDKELEKMGQEAGREARAITMRLLKRGVGPSLTHTLKRLKEATDATRDEEGRPDHRTRLEACKLSLALHDAMPNPKLDVESGGQPISFNIVIGEPK